MSQEHRLHKLRQQVLNMGEEDIQRFITEHFGEPSQILWLLFEHANDEHSDEECKHAANSIDRTLRVITDHILLLESND